MISEYELLERILKKIKAHRENYGSLERFDENECYATTIAIKKQMAKKPMLAHNTLVPPHDIKKRECDNWYCPECIGLVGERFYIDGREKILDQWFKDYCNICGQRIDWSEKQ